MGDTQPDLPGNVISAPGRGRRERVLGVSHLYKAESRETAGALTCLELTVPPGEGIPPHVHTREDEAFYVLSGSVTLHGAGDPALLETGGFFRGPRGHAHGFRNDGTEPATLLIFITPGTGLEAMFGELAALTGREEAHTAPGEIAELCGRYGVTFTDPPPGG